MSLRVLAVSLLIVSILSGYMRFGRPPSEYLEALTVIFLVSTTAFVIITLRMLAQQVDLLGESVSHDRRSRHD